MDEKKIVTKENYKEVFNSLKYGMITVYYESEEVRILFNNMITVMNEFTKKWTVEEKKAVINDIVNGEWVSTEVDDLYQVLYKNNNEPLAIIANDNYEIENFAILAKESGILCNINNFEPALTKYAKRIASKYNVKFTGSGFNGSMKSLSVRKQIEEAFLHGKYNISFPSDLFNVQTIRNHTSTYGSLIGRKFKVELSKGFIIVHFKDIEETNNLLILVKESFDKLGLNIGTEERDLFFNNLLGNTKKNIKIENSNAVISNQSVLNNTENNTPVVPETVYKLYGKLVSKEEYVNAENWQRSGYASKYNWENDIKGDIDMYPKDARLDENFSEDDDEEPAKYNWNEDETDSDDF